MLIRFQRIDDLRADGDLKVKDIADILGITADNFSDYANGRSNFPLTMLNKMVNYFRVSFDYITGLSDVKVFYDKDIDLKLLKVRLKKVRKLNNLTQDEAAHVIGDKQSTYWNYETGCSIIPISKLYLFSKFYNVSIDYFVGKTNDMKIKRKVLVKE